MCCFEKKKTRSQTVASSHLAKHVQMNDLRVILSKWLSFFFLLFFSFFPPKTTYNLNEIGNNLRKISAFRLGPNTGSRTQKKKGGQDQTHYSKGCHKCEALDIYLQTQGKRAKHNDAHDAMLCPYSMHAHRVSLDLQIASWNFSR